MIENAYAVYDSKAQVFTKPSFSRNDAEVIRSFSDQIAQEGNPLNKHAEDFTLFHIGAYDPDQGLFESIEPRSVVTAISLKAALDNG